MGGTLHVGPGGVAIKLGSEKLLQIHEPVEAAEATACHKTNKKSKGPTIPPPPDCQWPHPQK